MHNECTKRIRKPVKQNLRIYAINVGIYFIYWCIQTSKMIFGRLSGITELVELFYLLTTHYTVLSFVL